MGKTGEKIEVEPIGVIRSPFETKEECPIQPSFASNVEGRVEVFEKYSQGLKDIEGFSHLYIVYYFDRAGQILLVRPTFLDDEPHGIFASRHPCRPCGLGISVVELKKRKGRTLIVEGIDVLDGTPLLDIKPYVPKFDCFRDASEGWTAKTPWRAKPEGRE